MASAANAPSDRASEAIPAQPYVSEASRAASAALPSLNPSVAAVAEAQQQSPCSEGQYASAAASTQKENAGEGEHPAAASDAAGSAADAAPEAPPNPADKEEEFRNAMQFMNSIQFVGDMTRSKQTPLLDTIRRAGGASGMSPSRAMRLNAAGSLPVTPTLGAQAMPGGMPGALASLPRSVVEQRAFSADPILAEMQRGIATANLAPQQPHPPLPPSSLEFQESYLTQELRQMEESRRRRDREASAVAAAADAAAGGILQETIRNNQRAAEEASQILEKYGLLEGQQQQQHVSLQGDASPAVLLDAAMQHQRLAASLSPGIAVAAAATAAFSHDPSPSPYCSPVAPGALAGHAMHGMSMPNHASVSYCAPPAAPAAPAGADLADATSRVIAESASLRNLLEFGLGGSKKKKGKGSASSPTAGGFAGSPQHSFVPFASATGEALAQAAVANAMRALPRWGGPSAEQVTGDPLLRQAMLEALCVRKPEAGGWEPDKKVLKSFRKATDAALQEAVERRASELEAEEAVRRESIEGTYTREAEQLERYRVAEEAAAWDSALRGEILRKRGQCGPPAAAGQGGVAVPPASPQRGTPHAKPSSVDPAELTHWLISKGWAAQEAAAFSLQTCTEVDDQFAAAAAAEAVSPKVSFTAVELPMGAPPLEEIRLGAGWVRKEERLPDGTSIFNWVRE